MTQNSREDLASCPLSTESSPFPLQHCVVVQSLSHVRLFATPWIVARILCPWNSPGKKTGVVCHSFLQGIFSTQGLNPGLLPCRQILYCLSNQGSPINLYTHMQILS